MAILNGSGIWSKMTAALTHLLTHGLAAEVKDVRLDIAAALTPLAAITVDEFVAPALAAATSLKTSVATSITAALYTGAALNGSIGVAAFDFARNVTVSATDNSSNAGYTGAVTFKGIDIHGNALTEAITIVNNATAVGLKAFAKITEIDVVAQPDALGHFTFGTGSKLGLSHTPKARTGSTTSLPPFREYVDAATPTAGVLDTTNGTYLPNAVPNGTHKYAVYYEYDATTTPNAHP